MAPEATASGAPSPGSHGPEPAAVAVEDVPCGACGSAAYEVLYAALARIDSPGSQARRCASCGLVYLSPRVASLEASIVQDPAFLERFHVPNAQALGLLDETGAPLPSAVDAAYAPTLARLGRGRLRILDLGCGLGLFTLAATRAGHEAVGIDASPALAGFARERLGVDARLGELEALGPDLAPFDAVCLWDVIEHLHAPRPTLQAVRDVLRPGGRVLLSTPNWNSVARERVGQAWQNFVTGHYYYFERAALKSMLESAGLTAARVAVTGLSASERAAIEARCGPDVARRDEVRARSGGRGSVLHASALAPGGPRGAELLALLGRGWP